VALSETLKKIIALVRKRNALLQEPGRPSRAQIEELRRKASEALAKAADQPLTEKDWQDVATLEAVDATKH
jgi:ElaB/YqjD/DUF883 family membrane-anchored ribosome-binding protein